MLTLLAPVTGIVVPLDEVPDPVFAQRLAGDGVSIDPLGEEVVAPCDAVVLQVHRAGHAVTLDANGLEIVIHVGLDTVQLRGEGFRPLVRTGDRVRTGDPLLRFDADVVARRARSLLTEVVVSNMDRVAGLRPRSGTVTAGRDVLIEIDIAGAGHAGADRRRRRRRHLGTDRGRRADGAARAAGGGDRGDGAAVHRRAAAAAGRP
jgi:phosphocarrier protein FPr